MRPLGSNSSLLSTGMAFCDSYERSGSGHEQISSENDPTAVRTEYREFGSVVVHWVFARYSTSFWEVVRDRSVTGEAPDVPVPTSVAPGLPTIRVNEIPRMAALVFLESARWGLPKELGGTYNR